MFTSHLTRPLRWAIPLAVLGGIAAAPWFFRPLTLDIDGVAVPCREVGIAAGDFRDPCAEVRRDRFIGTGLIVLLGGLPLALVALRACILSADLLVSNRDELRRLHERLDRLDSAR